MISFVVQNFQAQPFLIKTQKYNALVVKYNTDLLYTFIKVIVELSCSKISLARTYTPTYYMFRSNFIKPFWLLFKKLTSRKAGIMSLNLTKSYYHHTIANLYNSVKKGQISHPLIKERTSVIPYTQPQVVLPFSFQKQTYNTLMFYILFQLVTNYATPQKNFKLYHAYILRPQNFVTYSFLNLFYFRLTHF
jgi:hypothetical protein